MRMLTEAYNASQKVCKAKMRSRNRIAVLTYLAEHPCVACGETDPVVLEFDHRNPAEKCLDISKLMPKASLRTLMAEIQKCDIRCANCHRRKSHLECGGWRKSLKATFPPALLEKVQANFSGNRY